LLCEDTILTVTTSRNRGRPKAFHDKSQSATIQSLDRAVGVLKTVAEGNGMSLTEVAETSGQAAATCYRILTTLRKHRIVEFDEASQLWHVGLEAYRIGTTFIRRNSIAEQSRHVMQRIMTETGETANLAILDRGEVVFISQIESNELIRAFFRPGTRGAAHASGIGKAIMAYLPDRHISELLPGRLERFTANTITGRPDFVAELAEIRANGWAVDDEERTVGMRCIAAPMFNAFGEAIAGISLSGPSVRVRRERDAELGALIRAAADEVTRATGGRIPAHDAAT
jgi:IclR family transcriptional regulator, acetate operon repressor